VTTELKPCPFCGGDEYLRPIEGLIESRKYVCCPCGAYGPFGDCDIGAIEAWNKRHCIPCDNIKKTIIDTFKEQKKELKTKNKYIVFEQQLASLSEKSLARPTGPLEENLAKLWFEMGVQAKTKNYEYKEAASDEN